MADTIAHHAALPGADVRATKWEAVSHAGHFRRHPKEYGAALEAFRAHVLARPFPFPRA